MVDLAGWVHDADEDEASADEQLKKTEMVPVTRMKIIKDMVPSGNVTQIKSASHHTKVTSPPPGACLRNDPVVDEELRL